jgi:hypothetical protein
MDNPFKYGGVVRAEHFADRQQELKELTREMAALNRVFLVSPRRYGKTCLLFNLMDRLQKRGVACAFVDLNAFPHLGGLAGAVASTTARSLETNTQKIIKFVSGFQRLRPKITVAQNGSVSVGMEVPSGESDPLRALVESLNRAETLAKRKRRKLIIIVDEFSDLAKYNGQTIEKALRSEIQKHAHIGYILSGSEQSVMLSMVQDPTRAFYKLGRIMKLGPIRRQDYSDFITDWFDRGRYRIQPKDLEQVFDIGRDVPHNVQRLCHVLWESARRSRRVTPALISDLPDIITRQDAPHYEIIWQTATQPQKALLIALGQKPAESPFSRDFMFSTGLGPASSIKASLDSLLKKGILFKSPEGRYRFVDAFMPYWIERIRTTRL